MAELDGAAGFLQAVDEFGEGRVAGQWEQTTGGVEELELVRGVPAEEGDGGAGRVGGEFGEEVVGEGEGWGEKW